MLTQIEWWGGLLMVLGAVTYRFSMAQLEKRKGFDWYRVQLHLAFSSSLVLLAAYFYTLNSIGLQYAYLGILGVALIGLLMMVYQETTSDEAETAHDAGADEDDSTVFTVLGYTALYSPMLAACGLGCYKAWPIIQSLMSHPLPIQ
ncbi:MAG: hypothetical protein V4627_07165 [Pseudomonadota bacterium]